MNIYQALKLLALRKKSQNRNKWTREKLEQHRNKALSELCEYAYANSLFYQKFHNGLFVFEHLRHHGYEERSDSLNTIFQDLFENDVKAGDVRNGRDIKRAAENLTAIYYFSLME